VVKYYAFPAIACEAKGEPLAIGLEKVADMEEELEALHAEHFAETEVLYLSEPMDVDYEKYKSLEKEGMFLVFTARVASNMVGYLMYYLYRNIHVKTVLQAKEDAFFVTKAYRGSGVAPKMLAYAESRLRELHCDYIGMSSKAPVGGPDLDSFLKRRGYKPVAIFYSKKLES
jgi:GNAT superfamily N-acetyltransferase